MSLEGPQWAADVMVWFMQCVAYGEESDK